MNLRNEFPLILYRNLTRREDRRLRMETEFERLGLPAERLPAVNGRYVRRFPPYPNGPRKASALSMRMALRLARLRGVEAVCLFEDDVVFHPEFHERLEAIELPKDWGMFYLGCQHMERPQPVALGLVRVARALDTHAWAVRREYFIEAGRRLAGKDRGQQPRFAHELASDVLLSDLHPRIPTYAAWPNLAWQLDDLSDIARGCYSNYDQKTGAQVTVPAAVAGLCEEMVGRWGLSWLVSDPPPRSVARARVRWRGKTRLKLHLGCGPVCLEGWENLDLPEVDIRDPLPFGDRSARFIFLEHVIEHVSPAEAWRFFTEARRVLEPRGVLRLAFPDIELAWKGIDRRYLDEFKARGLGRGGRDDALRSLICDFGHRAIWTAGSMQAALEAAGFEVTRRGIGESAHDELRGIERHGTWIGEHANKVQTVCLEAGKAPAIRSAEESSGFTEGALPTHEQIKPV